VYFIQPKKTSFMNCMRYRGYTARIDYDSINNILIGVVVGMKDQLSFHGASVDELRADFEFAVDHYLASCAAEGIKPERQASGRLLIRIPQDTHAEAAIAAAAESISLNEWIVRALAAQLAGVSKS
jgi:predicted HicB family RNase H-like nuclease